VNLSNIFINFCFAQIPYELPVMMLKQALHDFLEEKNELPEQRPLFVTTTGYFIWHF